MEALPHRGAVDPGRLLERARQLVVERPHHPDHQRQVESEVDDDEAGERVEQLDVSVHEEVGDGEGDRRGHAAGQYPERDRAAGAGRPARQGVGRRHADQERQHRRDRAHDQAVGEGVAELRGPQRGVVGPGGLEEQPRREAEDLGIGLERHQDQPQERRQRQHGERDRQRMHQEAVARAGGLLSQCALPSRQGARSPSSARWSRPAAPR